ncbi:hypothetical protein FACS1894142_7500 [Spirochaetia bacterium]|nr:hypothetical protein FACS1894142_7500 [Spirochaetia bacterium]
MGFKDKFKDFQEIVVNKNILLRQVNPEKDLQAYNEIYTDKDVFQYYESGSVKDIEHLKIVLNNQLKETKTGRIYNWTIEDRKKDFAIGRILLSDFKHNNTIANIGYFLNRKYWNKGIMTSCVKSVVEFGFKYLELERIYSTVMIDNVGSWKVLEKNGFLREGILRKWFWKNDKNNDCYMYSKLNTD